MKKVKQLIGKANLLLKGWQIPLTNSIKVVANTEGK